MEAKPRLIRMTRRGNPLGQGTINLSANVPRTLYAAINELASESGLSMGKYIRTIMEYATQEKIHARETRESQAAWMAAAHNGDRPFPKRRFEAIFPQRRITSEPR